MKTAILSILMGAGLLLAGPAGANALPYYEETGDAGGLASPQIVGQDGGVFYGITSSIGDSDKEDAFWLWWEGGTFIVQLQGNVEVLLGLYPTGPFQPQGPIQLGDAIEPSTFNPAEYRWNDLIAGNYILDMTTAANDPPLSSGVFTLSPAGAQVPAEITPPHPTPEPSSLALLALGALALHRGPRV